MLVLYLSKNQDWLIGNYSYNACMPYKYFIKLREKRAKTYANILIFSRPFHILLYFKQTLYTVYFAANSGIHR